MKTNFKYLVIQTNKDGRPCGWGLSKSKAKAESEARKQYASHGPCYDGEEKGKRLVHFIEEKA